MRVRASELLRRQVVGEDGDALGRVSDVRIVHDRTSGSYRIDAIVVGRAGLAERLGFVRAAVTGPWLVRLLFTRLERHARVVEVHDVVAWDDGTGRVITR